MNTWGTKMRLSIFGESHGEALGIVIDGLEAGTKLNLENINKFIDRRRAGKSSFTTSRKEKDEYRILSGYKDGHTTGAPLCVIFENTNTQSKDYEDLKVLLRPNHADYPAAIKFEGFNDIRGRRIHFRGDNASFNFCRCCCNGYFRRKRNQNFLSYKKDFRYKR